MTLLSSSPGPQDDWSKSNTAGRHLLDVGPTEIDGETYHLDPWHKLMLGWTRPAVYDIRDTTRVLSLSDGPVIVYDSIRGFHEYYIFEQRPTDGFYDVDVTLDDFHGLPIPGVAVWYVKTKFNDKGELVLEKSESVNDPKVVDTPDKAAQVNLNFSLGHFGTHIGDPSAAASRGTRRVSPQNRLWREGTYHLKWLDANHVLGTAFDIEISNPAARDWRVQVLNRDSTPAFGGLLGQRTEAHPTVRGLGTATVSADFDGDGIDDLAVGAPGGTDASGSQYPGTVHLYRGGESGLVFEYQLPQSIVGTEDINARFGDALATGDFDGDGNIDLAVGPQVNPLRVSRTSALSTCSAVRQQD